MPTDVIPVGEDARILVERVGRNVQDLIYGVEEATFNAIASVGDFVTTSDYDLARREQFMNILPTLRLRIDRELMARGLGTQRFDQIAEDIVRNAAVWGWAGALPGGMPGVDAAGTLLPGWTGTYDRGQDITPAVFEGLTVLAGDLSGVFSDVRARALRYPDDAYRRLTAGWAAKGILGAVSWDDMRRGLLEDFAAEGIPPFIDRAGRRWSAGAYAEMASRTATLRASQQASLFRMRTHNVEYVSVLGNADACELCARWFGKILRIGPYDGANELEMTFSAVDDQIMHIPVAGSLEEARNSGLFHPNCFCVATAYIPGMSVATSANGFDPERAAAREQQRALERGLRLDRRKFAAATVNGDQVGVARYRRRIREAQADLRTLTTRYDVSRRYAREAPGWDGGVWPRPPRQYKPKPFRPGDPKALGGVSLDDLFRNDDRPFIDLTQEVNAALGKQYGSRLSFEVHNATLNRYDGTDLSAWIPGSEEKRGTYRTVEVSGSIMGQDSSYGDYGWSNEPVGSVAFRIGDAGGYRWVDFDLMDIYSPDQRGTGFSSELSSTLSQWWAANGVQMVRTHAALSDGGWAWANAGFQWDPTPANWQHSKSNLVFRLTEELPQNSNLSSDDLETVAMVAQNLETFVPGDEELMTPQDIAQITGDAGNLGELILRGSSWFGIAPIPPMTYSKVVSLFR